MKIDDLPKGKDFNWQLLIRPGQMCFEIFFLVYPREKQRYLPTFQLPTYQDLSLTAAA